MKPYTLAFFAATLSAQTVDPFQIDCGVPLNCPSQVAPASGPAPAQTFALSQAPTGTVFVFRNGLKIPISVIKNGVSFINYSVDGQTITFSGSPNKDQDMIEVVYYTPNWNCTNQQWRCCGTWGCRLQQTGADLALGKIATQISDALAPLGLAGNAVDGNTDGNWSDNSVTHTWNVPNAWWQVDLGAGFTISTITIWNRTDCCGDRLSDYWVFVSGMPFLPTDTPTTLSTRANTWGSHQTTQPSSSAAIIVPGVQGQYVRVQLSGTNFLSLAEVQVQ